MTGGGTAGHVLPAVPVMAALRERGCEVAFVGSTSGLEEELLAGENVRYFGIASGKLRRYFSLENLGDAFRVLRGVVDAYRVLGRYRPDVVFSKGGFVSFPVVFAAWLKRVPVVAHESDLTPGLANRLALPFLRTLCVNFPDTRPGRFSGRVVHTGTPIRAALLQGDRERGRRLLEIDDERPVLLVTGGSLGADALNAAVREALPRLLERMHVVHVCGPGKTAPLTLPGYRQFEYVRDEWGDMLAAADLVLSRAGANTLFELLSLRKLNVLVPLSKRASRGDQLENAAYAEARGLSLVIEEEALTVDALVAALERLLAERAERLERLRAFVVPDAVTLLRDEILAQL
jgi:UDP-N-acetylglucosamine--N-acetylmuramyl-(pentapeptide) pyrophosphoryl-undecaprenol N-acetylglucosamine transferase